MRKLPVLIVLACLLLVTAGVYYYYQTANAEQTDNILGLIPGNALLVYEKDDCASCIESLDSPVWKILEKAAFYSKSDSLRKSLIKFIATGDKLFVSLYPTKKDDFDFLFFLSFKTGKSLHFDEFENPKYKAKTRVFNGVTIHEVAHSGQVFSWSLFGDVWAGSFTPFLIEDAIRTFNGEKPGFQERLGSIQKLSVMKGDAGNVYLQLGNLSEGLSVFATNNSPVFKFFAQESILDLKNENNNFNLNGFSKDSSESQFVISVFRNQTPVAFHLKHLVSERSVLLHTFGISDGKQFKNDLESLVKNKAPRLLDSLRIVEKQAGVDLALLYASLAGEIGVSFTESVGKEISKTIFIETTNPAVWLKTFNAISDKFSKDTVFFEQFADYQIREIPAYRFQEKLFWPLVSGFDRSYYTSKGNFIFIADDVDELKKHLNDIDQDLTWGKSVAINKFLETTLLESSLSIYINTPGVWNTLTTNLHPRWKQFVRENQILLRSLQLGAIQFSHLNDSYYTNVSWSYNPIVEPGNAGRKSERVITNFNSNVASVFTVKSHINRTDELLVQDSLNDLSLVSVEGEILWKIPVGDRIVSDVEQIDFFGNGKLQYFFATRDALHVIDRLGNYVSPYPLHFPGAHLTHASVIDYDHSKKYRFLIADISGKLRMFDKEGNNLDGWNPKDLQGELAEAPQHHRIKGRDYIIAIRKDGTVYLMNRRGEHVHGFPIKPAENLARGYFFEKGKNTDDYFVVISNDGFKIKFTLDGKVQSRETLLKTSVNTRFRMVTEKSGRSYLIQQYDDRQFNLLDDAGKKFISNEFIGGNPAKVDYYDFGSGNVYVTISDQTQGLIYLYDSNGVLLTSTPISSSLLTVRPINSQDIRLFIVQGKSLTIQAF